MIRKKVVVKAPALSRSGYGEQSRFALEALRSREDLFDIYVINIPWGATGVIAEDTPQKKWIMERMIAAAQYIQQQGQFDISLQITVPNEFEKMAPVNVGYTAGIETTKVAPEWLEKCNTLMDKLVVVSEHSKKVFLSTKYSAKNNETGQVVEDYGIQIPVEAISYPIRKHDPEPLEDIEFTTDNNFLVVSQWGPRKNVENTIKWFVEEFKEDANAGLVLKTNTASDSIYDRQITTARLNGLLSAHPDRKCKIYLLHGEITPNNLSWLYNHPKIKALVNIGHGEGWGLPLYEACCNGLPVVTITWSGQLDFLGVPNKKGKNVPKCVRVDYDIKPVQKEAVWPGVIQEDSMWAYARENSYKRALKDVLEKEKHYKHHAKQLQKHILKTLTPERLHAEFIEHLYGKVDPPVQIEDLPAISLITSVYRAADHIEQLMEDVTRQSIFEEKCEWIMLNANPPGEDAEEEVILKYVEKYPKNIVYKRLDEDPGVYGTWNAALEMATGKYITNMNCDDRRRVDALELQAKMLYTNPEVDLVYNDSYVVHEPNIQWEDVDTDNTQRYNFEEYSAAAMLRGNLPHNNPMWDRRVHEKHGTFDDKYRSGADWEFWLRCAFGGSTFMKHPEPLGVYYFNPNGVSTNTEWEEQKREEEKEIFQKYLQVYQESLNK